VEEQNRRTEHAFLVRIWQEADNGASADWRGFIEHVSTKQRLYFSEIADLNDFVRLRLQPHGHQSIPAADKNL